MQQFNRDIRRNKDALNKIKYTSGSNCINEMLDDINKTHPKKAKLIKGKKVMVK